MIDITRWVLSEAWIANGLRIRFARSYEKPPAETFGEDARFWYAGHGEWIVLPSEQGYRPYGQSDAPVMSVVDMRHELAHFLIATADQRALVNFGGGDLLEERAVAAESVLSSIINAAARIADMALTSRRDLRGGAA